MRLLVVGAGLSGATVARLAAEDGHKVTVIEKRNHIGGNVYDEIDELTGIRVSKYGAHLFHTNDKEVWDYVQRFGPWIRWDHRVLADISGRLVPVPANINTVNSLFGESIQTEEEMRDFLSAEQEIGAGPPANSEEVAMRRVGRRLFRALFETYTQKQWAKEARELEPLVLERIPVRTNHDDRYFTDKYQGLPLNGYTSIVESMLAHPNIEVRLNTAWDPALRAAGFDQILFTGPIDGYFKDAGLPALEYRSIEFHWERIPTSGFYQPNSVVNYPGPETPFTRCVEYKHFWNQKSSWTILSKELTCDQGEPYYPVPTAENRALYDAYKALASQESGVHFLGRLANYKYFNMDQAIRNAMDYYWSTLQKM
jgi:UDP-galactopyranose mutase